MLSYVHLSPWNRLVSPKLEPHLKYWSVSDWVVVVEFALPVTKGSRPTKLYAIVAYGPHSKLCVDNTQTRNNFYDSLNRAWKQANKGKSLTSITGDLNSKVGCRQSIEEDCMGVHGEGTRNENGQALIDWLPLQHSLSTPQLPLHYMGRSLCPPWMFYNSASLQYHRLHCDSMQVL